MDELPDAVAATLAGILVMAAAVWLGGLVVLVVVTRVAARTLTPAQRVPFFRGLGRSYGAVGGIALIVALVAGALLAGNRPWDTALTSAVVIAAALLLTTAVGVVQARAMTRLRLVALRAGQHSPVADQLRRGARNALALRALVGLLSFALLAIGVLLATS